MRSDRHRAKHRGFTLIEVMVALAVVSLGLIAVFNGIIQISDQSSHLRERTFAHWVAMNEIARMRVAGAMPELSEFDGDAEFADTAYRWEAVVSETGVEDLRRIDMRVSYAETPDDVLAEVVGFVAPRPPPAAGGSPWSGSGQSGRGDRDDDRDDDDADDPADDEAPPEREEEPEDTNE
jgi:general secretion pathway protein I